MRGRSRKLLVGAVLTSALIVPVALVTGTSASGPTRAAVRAVEATTLTAGPTVPPETLPAPPPTTEPPPAPAPPPEPPPTTSPQAPIAAVATSWPTSLQPCGGDLPPCEVKWRESHGDYNAVSPDGLYRGAWQFAYGTWGGYGGYALANEAPPELQDARAREVWAGGAGCGHWGACS